MWYVWITCVNNFTLQSRFIFLRYCDVSFVMSQLRYKCFCYNKTIDVIFWYVQVTHKRYVVITLFLGLSLWYTLYHVTATFFQVPKKSIFNNIRNAYVLCVRSNYVQKNDTIILRSGSSFLDYFFIRLHNILK